MAKTAAEPLRLDELPPELLNKIVEIVAADDDVLQPRHLGCLARSCKVIKEAVRDAKDKLKVKYDAASALLVKCGDSVDRIVARRPALLGWSNKFLTAADSPALTNVLKSKALEQLEGLYMYHNSLSSKGAIGLPRLKDLGLCNTKIGTAGVQALASAFAGGAFRELEELNLNDAHTATETRSTCAGRDAR